MTFERLLFVFWFSKSRFNVSQAETLPVETLQKKNKHKSQMPWQHRGIFETFSLYVPFSPPVINHIYYLWTAYNSLLSCSSITGETCWGKLTQLLYQIEIPQSIHFQEHHHYFIFSGKWTAQFCLITSCALMHYKWRNAFTTFRVVVRRWDKPDQYSQGHTACLMIISHFARLNSIFWIKDWVSCSEWMTEENKERERETVGEKK